MKTSSLSFSVGRRLYRADRIVPVFLPFAGCPQRCLYCAQDRQTGQADRRAPAVSSASAPLPASASGLAPDAVLMRAQHDLHALASRGLSAELAFYGGTFTALPEADRERCLAFTRRMRDAGLVMHARCSTRPDTVAPGEEERPAASTPHAHMATAHPTARQPRICPEHNVILHALAEAGIDLVELGIQSFSDEALRQTGRGYTRLAALAGCRAVTQAGLKLGIQLMPGMPGVTPEVFLRDVDQALALNPACLRFYPCLVPEGTGLAALWRKGRYTPWSVEETADVVGEGLRRAWAADVPVVRLAVAPEAGFDADVLAGPRHPAMGALIQASALLKTVGNLLPGLDGPPDRLFLPRSCQGYLYGERGALRDVWRHMGLGPERLVFTNETHGRLVGNRNTDEKSRRHGAGGATSGSPS